MTSIKSVLSGTFKKSLMTTALLTAPVVCGFVAAQVAPGQTVFTAGVAEAASVQPMQPAKQRLKPRRLPGLSQSFIKKLQEVGAALDPSEEQRKKGAKSNPKEALRLVNAMAQKEKMDSYNPYEKVMIYTYYGSIYYSLENTAKTISSFEKLIAQSPNLPVGTEAQYLYTLAQLYNQEDQPAKALRYLKRWSKMVDNITANQYATIAQVYYTNKKMDNALANMLQAIHIYDAKGKVPKEQWLGFVRAVYYVREDYKASLKVVERLIRLYPKMSYWRQLVGLYYQLNRMDDYQRALDSMYVMGGLKKESELKGLASGFLDKDAPYKAAKILDKGINDDKIIKPTSKNLELLANSWRLADETDKALVEMQRAAKKSNDGDLYFNLARLLFSEDEYAKAAAAGRSALHKGGLKRTDSVWLTIGQAELQLGHFKKATKAFQTAAKDDRSKKYAAQWLKFVKKEKKRQEALKDEG